MSDEDPGEREEEEVEPEELVCAACGSADIHRRPRALYFFVIAAVAIGVGVAGDQSVVAFYIVAAAAIFSMISDRWLCTECGNSWK
jgi:hypothetical protein